MFDNFIERILLNVASQYVPKLLHVACIRANELTIMKEKIRTSPDEVEAWFNEEIEKVRNIDMSDLIGKLNRG
jgi:hypothetical protein